MSSVCLLALFHLPGQPNGFTALSAPLAWGKCMDALDTRDDFKHPVLVALDQQASSVHLVSPGARLLFHAADVMPYQRAIAPSLFFTINALMPATLAPPFVKSFLALLNVKSPSLSIS